MAFPSLRTAGLFCAATLAAGACSASRRTGAGAIDDGGGMAPDRDAGSVPPADAGPLVGGVCATAAAASPFGLVAIGHRLVGGPDTGAQPRTAVLLGVASGGRLRELHRFVAPPGGRASIQGTVAVDRGAAVIAVLGSLAPPCPGPPCPRARELFVWAADTEPRVVRLSDSVHHAFLRRVLDDGRVVVIDRTPDGFPRLVLVDPRTGDQATLPPSLTMTGHPLGAHEGWIPVVHQPPPDTDPWVSELAFAHPDEPAPVRLSGPIEDAAPWRGRWVRLEPGEPALGGSQVVVYAGTGAREAFPVPDVGFDATAVLLHGDHLSLRDTSVGGRPRALVDLRDGAVIPLPNEAFTRTDWGGVTATVVGDWYVASEGGRPRLRVDLRRARVEVLDDEVLDLPEGGTPLDALYCNPVPAVDRAGRVGVGLRLDETPGRAGFYLEPLRGATALRLGRPVHGVMLVSGRIRGPTWVLRGASSEGTFCPRPVPPWDDVPVPSDALVGNRIQLVRAASPEEPVVLPEGARLTGLDPSGTCAAWPVPRREGVVEQLTDLDTGETAVLGELGGVVFIPGS